MEVEKEIPIQKKPLLIIQIQLFMDTFDLIFGHEYSTNYSEFRRVIRIFESLKYTNYSEIRQVNQIFK